jgi:repressor of nif and glnA expression
VAAPALSKVEQAILAILDSHPDEEVSGRSLRTLLQNRGFRRTAPAFAFTMMSLEDKGLIACREVVRVVEGVAVTHRSYRLLQRLGPPLLE